MTSALRWAAMRAILMFHNCEGQNHKTVSTDHNLWRERRAEADSNRGPSAFQPNAWPLGQTGSQFVNILPSSIIIACICLPWFISILPSILKVGADRQHAIARGVTMSYTLHPSHTRATWQCSSDWHSATQVNRCHLSTNGRLSVSWHFFPIPMA